MSADHYLLPDWPAPKNVRAAVTLRGEGHSTSKSEGEYASFNLAAHVGDDAAAVAENRRQLQRELKLPAAPQWLEQIHSDRVIAAKSDGMVRTADASFTDAPGVVCAVLTADCLPLLMCDKSGGKVAAVHAGWRGLVDGIIRNTIEMLDCAPQDLLVWLGPAIGPQAFETGVEVLEAAFENALSEAHTAAIAQCFVPHSQKPLHFLADIYALARAELAELGIESVYGGDQCTVTDAQKYFSYRRDNRTGRMASLIWME